MAQGNLILGTMKGKLGDVVAYNYNGKQAARVRRRQVSNPKTSKQAIQRAIAATVAKFVSAFAPVLNNSIQSESTKVKTLAKIRSLNMTMLRQQAALTYGNYAPKGSMYVAPNNYIISRGSLAGITPADFNGALVFADDVLVLADAATLTASQAFPTVAVGDQFTILASFLEDIAEGSRVGYCRFAFKDNTTPVFLADSEQGGFILNPAAIDLTKAEGNWKGLHFSAGSGENSVWLGELFNDNFDQSADMGGVIISREAGKLRSNAVMITGDDTEYTLAAVYPTYMDGGTPIDMPSELYLNNDANAQG